MDARLAQHLSVRVGQVAMSKVNWAAKQDFEFVANYKILQTAFAKFHVDRVSHITSNFRFAVD